MEQFKNQIASLLHKIGFSANLCTFVGLLFALASGYFVYKGNFFWSAVVLLISGFFDLMDGAIARQSGSASAFGGILDSSLDRYGDGAVLGGILLLLARQQRFLYAGLALAALLGSFEVSYVRARAECEIDKCKVGFWERGERVVFISLALLFNNLPVMLWVLAIGTQMTAFLRLYQSQKILKKFAPISASGRNHFIYYLKCCILALVLLIMRL